MATLFWLKLKAKFQKLMSKAPVQWLLELDITFVFVFLALKLWGFGWTWQTFLASIGVWYFIRELFYHIRLSLSELKSRGK